MQWKKHVYKQFDLPDRERSGLLLLILICIVAIGLPEIFTIYELRLNARLMAEYGLQSPLAEDSVQMPAIAFADASDIHKINADSLFSFDPNALDSMGWIRLGLSPRLCRTILRYRRAGGRFKTAEDLAAIYTLKKADYERLLPWITIADAGPQPNRNNAAIVQSGDWNTPAVDSVKKQLAKPPQKALTTPELPEGFVLDINTATPEQFARLPDFDLYLGRRAVRFRNALGGFAVIDQLADLFGLPDSIYRKVSAYLIVGQTQPKQLDVNSIMAAELASHPYMPPWIAERIVKYRDVKGGFLHVSELKKVYGVTDSLYQKLLPYMYVGPDTIKIEVHP